MRHPLRFMCSAVPEGGDDYADPSPPSGGARQPVLEGRKGQPPGMERLPSGGRDNIPGGEAVCYFRNL